MAVDRERRFDMGATRASVKVTTATAALALLLGLTSGCIGGGSNIEEIEAIFTEAEAEQQQAIREMFGPWLLEIDNGDFGPQGDVQGLLDDPRSKELCDQLIAIEQRANDDLNSITDWDDPAAIERAKRHLYFLAGAGDLGIVGALYDNGMVTEPPPAFFDIEDYDAEFNGFDPKTTVTSDGILNGQIAHAYNFDAGPLSAITICVNESPASDMLRLGTPES